MHPEVYKFNIAMSRIFSFLLGAGTGAIGAVWLLDPSLKKSKETLKVDDNAQKLKQKVEVVGQELKHKAEDLGQAVKHKAEDVGQAVKHKAEDFKK